MLQYISYALVFVFCVLLPLYLPLGSVVAKATTDYRIRNFYLFSFFVGAGLYGACAVAIMYFGDTPATRTFYVPAIVALAVLFAMIIFIRNAYLTEVCVTPEETTILKMSLLLAFANIFIVGLYTLIANYDFNVLRDFMKMFMMSLADSSIRKDKAKKFHQTLRDMMDKKERQTESEINTFLHTLLKIEDRDVFITYLNKYIEYYSQSIQDIKTSAENSSLFEKVEKLEFDITSSEQRVREALFKNSRMIKVAQKAYDDYPILRG